MDDKWVREQIAFAVQLAEIVADAIPFVTSRALLEQLRDIEIALKEEVPA